MGKEDINRRGRRGRRGKNSAWEFSTSKGRGQGLQYDDKPERDTEISKYDTILCNRELLTETSNGWLCECGELIPFGFEVDTGESCEDCPVKNCPKRK